MYIMEYRGLDKVSLITNAATTCSQLCSLLLAQVDVVQDLVQLLLANLWPLVRGVVERIPDLHGKQQDDNGKWAPKYFA